MIKNIIENIDYPIQSFDRENLKTQIKFILLIIISITFFSSCKNPFAPKLNNSPQESTVISDQKTVNGVFDNFRYAYVFKDTVVYGRLLASDFIFVYRDYEKGADDLSWGREEDMLSTNGLFQATQSLDLIWNNIVTEVEITNGDTVLHDVSRGFSLTIVFSPSDVVRIQGRVNLRLRKMVGGEIWQMVRWRDESNY